MLEGDNLKKSERIMDQLLVRFFRNSGSYIAGVLAKTPVTPNAVSTFGLMLIIFASLLLASGSYGKQIAASFLLVFAVIIDFTDGSLAGMKGMSTEFGDWFDSMIDEVREFLVIFCLAYGLFRVTHDHAVWVFAFVLLGADALMMRAMVKFSKRVNMDEHASEVRGVIHSNPLFRMLKELISVRLLRYATLPVFTLCNATAAYLKFFAIYGMMIAVLFLVYCGFVLKKRDRKFERK